MPKAKEHPEKTVLVWALDKNNGVRYQEERRIQYDSELANYVVLSSRRTGLKLMPGATEPVPTRKKRPNGTGRAKKAASAAPASAAPKSLKSPTSPESRPTLMKLLSWAAQRSGVAEAVRGAFLMDRDTAERLLFVAGFMAAAGRGLDAIDCWAFQHDFDNPEAVGLSEEACYELFDMIGRDEAAQRSLFRSLAGPARDGKEEKSGILALVTVSEPLWSESEAGGGWKPSPNVGVRPGFGRGGDGLDRFTLVTLYSKARHVPVAFSMSAGDFPSAAALRDGRQLAQELGLPEPQFVLGAHAAGEEAVCEFCRTGAKFTVPGAFGEAWIRRRLVGDEKAGIEALRPLLDEPGTLVSPGSGIHGVTAPAVEELSWKQLRPGRAFAIESFDLETKSASFPVRFHYFLDEEKRRLLIENFYATLHSIKERREAKETVFGEERVYGNGYLCAWGFGRGTLEERIMEDEARAAEQDFGISAFVSNGEEDAKTVYENERLRRRFEAACCVIRPREGRRPALPWPQERILGKELCRLLGLGLRSFLENAFERVRLEAKARGDDAKQYGAKDRKAYAGLAAWLEEKTTEELFAWFDAVPTGATNRFARERWSDEALERDQLFWALLSEA